MEPKETKLRIEPSLDEWLATQAAIADIPKTKYIIQVLEDLRSNAEQTHPNLSPKLSLVDGSIYDEVAALKARVTKLEQGSPKSTPAKPQFYVDRLITAQSSKTYDLLWRSFEASQKIDRKEYHLSNELGIVCKVIGTSKSNKKKLRVVGCFQGKKVVINEDRTFLFVGSDGYVAWNYQELEPTTAEALSPVEPTDKQTPIEQTPIEVVSTTLEEPTSAVKLSSDEVAIEAITEATRPQDEPLEEVATTPKDEGILHQPLTNKTKLKRNEFQAKFGSLADFDYGKVCIKGKRVDGWLSPDGDRWKIEGTGKTTIWTNESQPTLTI